ECREVFGEVEKDRCFGRAGVRQIAEAPGAWLALAPKKLAQLFNHGAVASAYLHSSNPVLVGDSTQKTIAAVETVYSRLLLLGGCAGLLLGASSAWGRGLAFLGGLFALSPWGYAGQLGAWGALLAGRPGPGRRPLAFLAASILGLCLVTHIVFFGAP